MKITKTVTDATAMLSLEGWLDTLTSPELGAELDKLESGISALVLDFEKLEYISSAGLRQLIIAYRKFGRDNLKIINVNAQVMEVFKMTGFDEKLGIS